jgi:hypothetical protein
MLNSVRNSSSFFTHTDLLDLGKFLYNNYKQALGIISSYVPEIERFKQTFGYQDDDFLRWRDEEIEYLSNLSREPEHDILATAYVEALQTLHHAEYVSLSCCYCMV